MLQRTAGHTTSTSARPRTASLIASTCRPNALHKLFDDVKRRRGRIRDYPPGATSGKEHVDALSSALATFGAGTRRAIQQVDELRDDDTADILTEISRAVDKWL
jgi:hypothetical protein